MKYFTFLSILVFSVLIRLHAQIDSNLLKSIKNNDLIKLEQLIKSGVNIHAVDKNGANPFMWAVHDAELPVLKLLVVNGAKPPESGFIYIDNDALLYGNVQGIAAGKSKLEILSYLADSLHLPMDDNGYNPQTKIKDELTPFQHALGDKHTRAMKYVLEKSRSRLGDKADYYLSVIDNWILNKMEFKTADELAQLEKWVTDVAKVYFRLNDMQYGRTLIILANIFYYAGQYEKMALYYEKGLPIYKEKRGKDKYYAFYMQNLGGVYNALGRYKEALPVLQDAAEVYLKLEGEDSNYALMISTLAILYKNLGDDDKEFALYQQALNIRKRALGEHHPEYAISLYNLAFYYGELGLSEKALPLCEQALNIYKNAAGEDANYAMMLKNYANILRRGEVFDKALPHFEKAAELTKKYSGEESPNYAGSLNDMALVYMEMGRYDEALYCFNRAVDIFKKTSGENPPALPTLMLNIASIYARKGEYEKGKKLLNEAMTLREKQFGKDHINSANLYMELSLQYAALNNIDSALYAASKVSEMQINHLMRLYPNLSEFEKINLLNSSVRRFYYLPSIALKIQKNAAAYTRIYENELKLKGIVLHSQQAVMNQIKTSNDSTALSIFDSWKRNKDFIAKQYSLAENKRSHSLDSVETVTHNQEKLLSGISRSLKYQTEMVTINDVIKHLNEQDILIEFIRFRVMGIHRTDSIFYAAMILRKNHSYPEFIPLFEEKELLKILSASNTSNSIPKTITFLYSNDAKSRGLYDLIWKPLEASIGSANKIYYVPVGLLHRISFAALTNEGSALIDKYNLRQLLSSRSIATASQQETKPGEAALWGDIQYDEAFSGDAGPARGLDTGNSTFTSLTEILNESSRGDAWQPLPGTKLEIERLGTLLKERKIKVSSMSRNSATESAFKALHGKSPELLHLATHGFSLAKKDTGSVKKGDNIFSIQSNPMFRSGLVLAGGNAAWKGNNMDKNEDGILTAFELAQIDLGRTKLAVLSACETALGDIKGYEGVIGLQRALKLAGVRQMILSLWQVPDKPTMELMTLFYKNWLDGQSTADALRSAQLDLKKKYPSPYYWAGFVLAE